MAILPGDAGSQPVRFAPRAAPPPPAPSQFRGFPSASAVQGAPRVDVTPNRAPAPSQFRGFPSASGANPNGSASPGLQALAHARIVQDYIHRVGDQSGSLFPGLQNLPLERQVPIVRMVLHETGLGGLSFRSGVEALAGQVNPHDRAQLSAMVFEEQPKSAVLGQQGLLRTPTQPDSSGTNVGSANESHPQLGPILQKPIPLAVPRNGAVPANPLPNSGIFTPRRKLV